MAKVKQYPSQLTQLLARFEQSWGRGSGEALSLMYDSGLTLPQLIVLHVLSLSLTGADTVTGLSSKVKLSPGATSQLIDRLVQDGMVMRTESTEDRRVRKVELADKGRAFLDRLREIRSRELHGFIAALPGQIAKKLAGVMREVVDALEDSGAVNPSPPRRTRRRP